MRTILLNCTEKILVQTIFFNLFTKSPYKFGSESPWCKRDSSKEKAKIKNPYNQIPHLDTGHHMAKWRKHKKTSHTRDQRGQPFPAGDHKSDVDLTISKIVSAIKGVLTFVLTHWFSLNFAY